MMKEYGIRRTYKLLKHYGQQVVRTTRSFERWYADEHARDIAFRWWQPSAWWAVTVEKIERDKA